MQRRAGWLRRGEGPTRLFILQKLMLRTGAESLPSGSCSGGLPSQGLSLHELSFPPWRGVCRAPRRPGPTVCWAGEAPCARSWKISAGVKWPTGAKMYLHTGKFLWTKEESKKRSLTLSSGQVRELAPMITARCWYRDGDDEASASNSSPTHHAHPRGEKRHSPSHKDTPPSPEGHRPRPAGGTLGGRTCHPHLKFCDACCEARTVLGKRTAHGRYEGPVGSRSWKLRQNGVGCLETSFHGV